ncbi:MAG: VOC family protein [Acidimicrobiia bacterium]
MPLTMFDHYTIRARDVEVSARFYVDVMAMRLERLDSFDFPFALLFLGDQAVVHMLGAGPALDDFLGRQAPSYGDGPERSTGNMEHVAFNATDRDDFVARLDRAGVAYVARTLADYGVHQLLFDDPDGIEIEVNFPIDE